MRPSRTILALLALAALALVGCTGGSSTHPAAAPIPPVQVGIPTASTSRPITTAPPVTGPAPHPSPPPSDPPAWSTGPRVTPDTDPAAQFAGIRTAEHATFDRVMFQFRGRVPGYDVSYVSAVTQDPSGQSIPLRGRAFLRVVLRHATTSPGPAGGPRAPNPQSPGACGQGAPPPGVAGGRGARPGHHDRPGGHADLPRVLPGDLVARKRRLVAPVQ